MRSLLFNMDVKMHVEMEKSNVKTAKPNIETAKPAGQQTSGKNKAVFLDRDGTINVEKGYLFRIEDFEFLPGAVEALKSVQDAGYKLIIITNQSGIARGYYTLQDFHRINNWMLETLEAKGVHINKVYFCPHHPEAAVPEFRIDCDCRKPKTGLYKEAVEEFDLEISECYAIGDKIRDCSICGSGGCHGFLIADNEKKEFIADVKAGRVTNVRYAACLNEAVGEIISQKFPAVTARTEVNR